MGNDQAFGDDKKKDAAGGGGGAGGGPKAPAAGGVAGTHDPNYQTLAGVKGDVFGDDKKDGKKDEGPKKPDKQGVAGRLALCISAYTMRFRNPRPELSDVGRCQGRRVRR